MIMVFHDEIPSFYRKLMVLSAGSAIRNPDAERQIQAIPVKITQKGNQDCQNLVSNQTFIHPNAGKASRTRPKLRRFSVHRRRELATAMVLGRSPFECTAPIGASLFSEAIFSVHKSQS